MSIQRRATKILNVEIPAAIVRLAVVAGVACLVATATVYSRDANAPMLPPASKLALVRADDRVQAEGRFTPTVKVASLAERQELDIAAAYPPPPVNVAGLAERQEQIATAYPLPRPRPATPGYYYELARAQGDGEEGEYVLVERQCRPTIDMPEPCYLPERERRNFPLRRE